MKCKVVGIGEVLWDLLPGGKQLGGAPANFVYHARSLGADAHLVSRVGNDANGREALARLNQLGVSTECIAIDPNAPTGTVTVEVAADGQPRFVIHEDVAWDRLADDDKARRAVAQADAICFGTLAQRSEPSREMIRRLLASSCADSLRILDVNLRQHFYSRELIECSLSHANVLKVNDAELPVIAGMFELSGDSRTQMAGLAERFALRAVACTRGARGSVILAEGRWSEHAGVAAKVADTVGAGDAFTAAMTLGLLAKRDLDDINFHANQVAAYVASSSGAMPELPNELRSPFVIAPAPPATTHT